MFIYINFQIVDCNDLLKYYNILIKKTRQLSQNYNLEVLFPRITPLTWNKAVRQICMRAIGANWVRHSRIRLVQVKQHLICHYNNHLNNPSRIKVSIVIPTP